jgi:micrococcal nuclease
MKKSYLVFGFFFLILITGLLNAQNEKLPVVNWRDANNYIGQQVIVEGTIVATYKTNKVCFLNFDQNWKEYFTAVIFVSDLPKFSYSPDQYLKNKKVKIKGTIKLYKGKPEIIVKNSDQIEVID